MFKKILKGSLALALTLGASVVTSSEVFAQDPVEIQYWHVNAETQGGQTVEALVEKFNASQDEIIVEAVFNADMYTGLMQNMQVNVASGEIPDIVQVGWQYVEYFSENFPYTAPQDVISQVDSENPDYLSETYLDNILDLAVNSNGDLVGLPYSISNPILYYNTELFAEAGIESAPTTWSEVRETAQIINENTDAYGLFIQSGNWTAQSIIESNGARMQDENGLAAFASPEGIEAFQLWSDMRHVDGSIPGLVANEAVQSFIQGDIGMLHYTVAQLTNIAENSTFEVGTAMHPSFEGVDEVRVPAGGAMLSITSQDEEKLAATWEFAKFLLESENVIEWTKGTGYVPPTASAAESEELASFLEERPQLQPAVDQMDTVVPWFAFPGDAGLEAEVEINDMINNFLASEHDIPALITETQETVNNLIQ